MTADTEFRAKSVEGEPLNRTRTIVPFVLAHDILRGVVYSLQALVHYGLMLAVM